MSEKHLNWFEWAILIIAGLAVAFFVAGCVQTTDVVIIEDVTIIVEIDNEACILQRQE